MDASSGYPPLMMFADEVFAPGHELGVRIAGGEAAPDSILSPIVAVILYEHAYAATRDWYEPSSLPDLKDEQLLFAEVTIPDDERARYWLDDDDGEPGVYWLVWWDGGFREDRGGFSDLHFSECWFTSESSAQVAWNALLLERLHVVHEVLTNSLDVWRSAVNAPGAELRNASAAQKQVQKLVQYASTLSASATISQ